MHGASLCGGLVKPARTSGFRHSIRGVPSEGAVSCHISRIAFAVAGAATLAATAALPAVAAGHGYHAPALYHSRWLSSWARSSTAPGAMTLPTGA